MEKFAYTDTETLLWDYSETEEHYVLVIPPARRVKTLYRVPQTYAYQWFGLNGGNNLKIIYYPFAQTHFRNLTNPCDCPPESVDIFASISVSPSSVLEDSGTPMIYTVTLDVASLYDTTVNFTLTGTAVEGVDYVAVTPSVTITAGQTTGTFAIVPIADAFTEGDETVIAALVDGTSGVNVVVISVTHGQVTGTIIDVPLPFCPDPGPGFATIVNADIASLLNADNNCITASVEPVVEVVTWDPPTAVNVALSNGNLTATNTTFAGVQGVQANVSFDSGKYYFEVTATSGPVDISFPFTKYMFGIGSPGGINLYSFFATRWTFGAGLTGVGAEYTNGSGGLGGLNESIQTGDVIGIAVDLDANKLWYRTVAGPGYPNPLSWNGSGDWGGAPGTGADTDPAVSVGGLAVPTGTMSGSFTPTAIFNDDNLTEVMTFNFGDSAFSGNVPFGYTAGWGTPSAGSSSDPNWASVVFLCGFNASSRDESTTNNKGDGGVATAVTGSYGFNATTFRWGTSSAFIRLNGIRWADSPDWNFDGNFTIEISYYTVTVAVGTATIISQWTTTGSQQSWRIIQVGATIRWEVSTTGANTFTDLTSGTILVNTYYDIMVDYDGIKYRLYLNGVMAASSATARVIFNSTSMMSIGSNPTGGANTGDNVFPDEARITKGVARCGSDGGYTVVGPFPRYVYTTSGTVLDPATANKVVLSNGNLTVTNDSVVDPEQIVSIPIADAKSSGKYYYEITLRLDSSNNGNNAAIFGLTTATYTGLVDDGGLDGIIVYESGNILSNEIFMDPRIPAGGLSSTDTGDVMGIAVDLDHGNVWFNVVGGPDGGTQSWNGVPLGDPTQNPSTNKGGVFLRAGSAFMPFAVFTGDAGPALDAETANFGATPFIGPVPTGFTAGWPIAGGNTPVALNTWDPTTAIGCTTSNGNLTVTNQGAAATVQGVKALVRKTIGKFYFEITLDHVNLASSNLSFGVAMTMTNYSEIIGVYDMSQVFVFLSGAIRQNGGSSGESIGQLHSGDVIGIAVELEDNFDGWVWFKVVAGPDAAGAIWNGDVGADPTDTFTGIYLDGNTVLPFVIFDSTDATEQITANFGATAFSGTVPTGFTAGWPA